jgi:hypothetical protein
MKKVLAWLILVSALLAMQLISDCSQPLESPFENGQNSPDTIIITDTVRITDTTEIIIPDTGSSQILCARLSSHRKEIVWMFRNDPGAYSLDFRAAVERDNPSRTIVIDIGQQRYFWPLLESLEYLIEPELEQDATIKITSIPPHAFGQAIDICLIIERSP